MSVYKPTIKQLNRVDLLTREQNWLVFVNTYNFDISEN